MIPCYHIWLCLYMSFLCCVVGLQSALQRRKERNENRRKPIMSSAGPLCHSLRWIFCLLNPQHTKLLLYMYHYLIYKDAVMCVYWVPHGTFVCVLSADTCSVLLHQSMWEEVRCVQGASLPSRTASSCASMNCPGMRRVSSARYVAARWAGPATAGTACFTASMIMRSKTV